MEIIILSIHLVVCICLIGLVLLQRSEGGALGMGGGGSGALMSGRGAADALAKMTQVAGGFFLVTSLGLTVLSGAGASDAGSVFDRIAPAPRSAPVAPAPTTTAPAEQPATQPDPTESSVTPGTQLAAITPGPASAEAAPAATAASERAAPLQPATTPASTQRNATGQRPTQTAAATTTQQRQPTTQRSTSATTPASATNRPLVLPNTSGTISGIALEDTQSQPESVEVGNGLEAVRRETRSGPDQ